MATDNKYVELAVWLGNAVKGAALMAAEDILSESAHVLTEANERLVSDGHHRLANASLAGLLYTHMALEKVRAW